MRRSAQEVAEERVAEGASALDRLRPNWFRAISLKELDLSDPCSCVCGQLARSSRSAAIADFQAQGHNGYSAYLWWMRRRLKWRFAALDLGFIAGGGTTYPALDAAWKRAIRARLRRAS